MNRPALQRLAEQLAPLTDAQLALIGQMADAMGRNVPKTINPNSDILTPGVETAIANQLVLHHATNEEKLSKKAFEFLFKAALLADGQEAVIVHNPTNPGADVIAEGTNFSLKTQADSAAKRHSIYIQKFMEARWIRDFDDALLAAEAKRRILQHLAHYERILILQALSGPSTSVTYRLIEVPRRLLLLMTTVPDSDFSPKNKYGSSGTDVRDERGVAYRVLLDGSVEKVRIFNLRLDRCVVHGEWEIPEAVG